VNNTIRYWCLSIPAGLLLAAVAAVVYWRRLSVWRIALAILPAALLGIPILHWCYATWGRVSAPETPVLVTAATASFNHRLYYFS
jgi:hypothetical protein